MSSDKRSTPQENRARRIREDQRVPSLRHHKATGQAFVVLNGRSLYLGKHGTPEAQRKYHQTIAEWLAAGRQLPVEPDRLTVTEMLARYWVYAEQYYTDPDGRVSSELNNVRLALKPVRKLYGDILAAEFGPLALRTVRDGMIRAGLARGNINKRISRIKMVFKWACSMELIPGETFHALQALPGLKRGRCGVREPKRVLPAPMELVDAVRPHVSRQVWAVIQLQLLTAARPGELLILRPGDIDRTGEVWIYQPYDHKTAHWGYDRKIYIGPRGQQVLTPFLLRPAEGFCFSPIEAERERYDRLVAERDSPKRSARRRSRKDLQGRYNVDGYRRAITRGLEKAFPPPGDLARQPGETQKQYQARLTEEDREAIKAWRKEHYWHPHQLRHNAATELRKEFGLEAARIILGHRSPAVTSIYAEQDQKKAIKAISQVG